MYCGEFCFCSHCGTQVHREDNHTTKIKQTIIHKDEAEIQQTQNKERKLEFEERAQKRKIRMIIVLAISVAIIIGLIFYGIMRLYNTLGEEGFIVLGFLVFVTSSIIAVTIASIVSDISNKKVSGK